MLNMCGAQWHPLHVCKKANAMCQDHADGIVVHMLRQIMPECLLKLVRGLYLNPLDSLYLGQKWW